MRHTPSSRHVHYASPSPTCLLPTHQGLTHSTCRTSSLKPRFHGTTQTHPALCRPPLLQALAGSSAGAPPVVPTCLTPPASTLTALTVQSNAHACWPTASHMSQCSTDVPLLLYNLHSWSSAETQTLEGTQTGPMKRGAGVRRRAAEPDGQLWQL